MLGLFAFAIGQFAYAEQNSWYNGNNNGSNNGSGSTTYSASLNGGNEVPSVSSNTSGTGSVTFNSNGENMTYSLSVMNGDEIKAAHLHCGDPGENGPVVAHIFSDANGTDINGQLASGSVTVTSADCSPTIGYDVTNADTLAQAITDGRIYVNVHSEQ
mgnify:FL=1